MSKFKVFLELHIMLLVYSICGVFSKKASAVTFLSLNFFVYYGIVFVLLAFYAVIWQQILKKVPLTTAYSNKAVTVIWGIIWGFILFDEKITIGKVIGAILVGIGIILYSLADGKEKDHGKS